MKNLRCKVCGEEILAKDLLQDEDGDFIFCPTCEGTKFIVIGTENEEIDTLYREEEEEEMVECICKYCGEEFEAEEELEVCEDCNKAIEEASNPALIIALAKEFGCYPKDVIEKWDGEYEIDGIDYLVLTDSEADDRVAECVEETLWAFSPVFLDSVTDVDEIVFEAIQDNGRCEGNNKAIMSILDATNTSISEVAHEAIIWDGRGHFLSQYDGQEIEVYADGEYYYCYRI